MERKKPCNGLMVLPVGNGLKEDGCGGYMYIAGPRLGRVGTAFSWITIPIVHCYKIPFHY